MHHQVENEALIFCLLKSKSETMLVIRCHQVQTNLATDTTEICTIPVAFCPVIIISHAEWKKEDAKLINTFHKLFVFMAVSPINTIFCNVILCRYDIMSTVKQHQRFEGACCLHLQGLCSPRSVAELEKWVYYIHKANWGSEQVSSIKRK
jgi:hypothetical protein